jgi:hypothetical protein
MIESIEKILLNFLISERIEDILNSVNERDLLTEKMCRALELIFMYFNIFCALLRKLIS